ncbi:MAG: glycosyltransferase family 4 protein [Actinomycetota bacterium]
MTRILVITNMYPPHHLGGYELSCRDVMDRLRDRGHDIEVLTTVMRLPGVADLPDEREHGIHRELSFYWDDHRLLTPSFRRKLAMERGNQRTLEGAIVRHRPEVVSAWAMGAMSLGLLTTVVERNIPLVLNLGDEWPWYGPNIDAWMRPFLQHPLVARVVRLATGVPTSLPDLGEHAAFCYVSEMIRRSVESKTHWKPRVAGVTYSGFDATDFPIPDEPPPERPWRWRLLHVGRLDERKGVHIAIRALAHLPASATLDIVGRGDERYAASLRALVAELGLGDRVRFSVSDRVALRSRYHDADACVFPSVWEEPFGLVPLEAMACGTPVVATATGGSGEFLLDGANCLVVPKEDPEGTASAIASLAANPARRARLVAGGLRTAREFSLERYADVLEEWHVAAAGRFANGRPPDRRFRMDRG